MKFLVNSIFNKKLFEYFFTKNQLLKFNILFKKVIRYTVKKISISLTFFLRFMFIQPRMVRQISPDQFEEIHKHKLWTGQFYV
jgi:hypothetical protein